MKNLLPPCRLCNGACCKQRPGTSYAVFLVDGDQEYGEAIEVEEMGELIKVLPYVDGKCIFLSEDNKCKIYNQRPQLCQQFNCVTGYNYHGGRHSFFLDDNPQVVKLLEKQYPKSDLNNA